MTVPAISVIMGAYNAEKYVGKAIESILNQSFLDFEFIIIDDGSKDSTGKIIADYAAKDSRIIAIHHDNMGHANSLNKALGLAKAPLIARMDADDIALPDRFKKQVEYLNDHPDIAVLGTSIRLIDDQDHEIRDIFYPISVQDIETQMLRGSPLAHPTVMMRKAIVIEFNGYRAVLDPAEDYDLWLRISEKYPIANLPEIHLLYRQHTNKLSFLYSQYGTLCTFVMQLASKARRNGQPDPLVNVKKVTIETLGLFDLNKEQKIDLLFKTYDFSFYNMIENNNDEGISDLFKTMQTSYSPEYFKKMRYLAYILLFRKYFDKNQYCKAYHYLFKIFFYSPIRFIFELSRSSFKKILPVSLKDFLKKRLKRS